MIRDKKIIALCTYGINEPQVFSFISELNELLKQRGCFMFIYAINTEIGNGGDFYSAEPEVFNLIPYDLTDAVIIMSDRIKSPEIVQNIIDRCNKNDIPSVVIDGEYKNASLVRFDYAKGFEAVVRHVIEHHRVRKPHFMAGKRSSEFSNERIEVFKKVLAENGITFDDSMLSYGDFWSIPSRAAAAEILKRDELPDAVICANDIMAINVCDVFDAAGVKVPDQVLVSGFDGIDEAFLSTPGITTAICDSQNLAAAVMKAVGEVLEGKRNVEEWIVPSFTANESCGCPRCDLNSLSKVHDFNNRFYHHQDDVHIMQNLTAVMMCSEKPEECFHHIRHSLEEKMFCVIEDACFDVENDYFLEDVPNTTQTVIYNSFSNEEELMPYTRDNIKPYLLPLLEEGYPIIFNVFEYLAKSIGLVAYCFDRYDLIDYTRISGITNCLSMGFGGFVNMHYQKYLRNKVQTMYQNDALTGLYNRVAFLSKFEEFKSNPEFIGQKLTIIMADLNGLKQINDNCGHSAGDKAIASVAKALMETCPDKSLCVRFGGDEMIALVPGEYDFTAFLSEMEERLKKDSEECGFTISASYGSCSTTLTESLNLDEIIVIADEEMYKMKKEKKNK